jgi:hypothetical protein
MKIDNFTKFVKNENTEEEVLETPISEENQEETSKEETKDESEDENCEECNEKRKIKNFTELIEEKELHNELPKNTDPAQIIKVAGPKNNLKTAPTVKGISVFLDDVKTNILSCCKDKGVAMSTYKISGNVGVDVKDVNNVLENLQEEGKVIKKVIGDEDYWIAT